MKLYELPAAFEWLAEKLDDLDGELTPDLENELAALEYELAHKVTGICCLVQRFMRQAEAAKAEADRLHALSRVRANAAARLKEYLQLHLESMGLRKYETDLFRVRIRVNSRPTIRWTNDLDALPVAFRRVSVALDGEAAYQAWKETGLPSGFEVALGSHLRIQ